MCCFSLAGPRSTLCLLTRPALPVLQLQAVYRGVAARKRVLKLLTAGEDIQRFFLMLRQRERFRGMVAASRIIQQGFRVCGEYGEGGGGGAAAPRLWQAGSQCSVAVSSLSAGCWACGCGAALLC
jgi:hypothetical protein